MALNPSNNTGAPCNVIFLERMSTKKLGNEMCFAKHYSLRSLSTILYIHCMLHMHVASDIIQWKCILDCLQLSYISIVTSHTTC